MRLACEEPTEASVGQRWPWVIHNNVVLLTYCCGVTESVVAEYTNAGVTVFVTENQKRRQFGKVRYII